MEDIPNNPNCFNVGYSLEVDLHYPGELHDAHKNVRLAPTGDIISYKNLSDWHLNSLASQWSTDKDLMRNSDPNTLRQTEIHAILHHTQIFCPSGIAIARSPPSISFQRWRR